MAGTRNALVPLLVCAAVLVLVYHEAHEDYEGKICLWIVVLGDFFVLNPKSQTLNPKP
ncbi:MAG: hypothetical protein ABSA16_11055 [Thermoguttaceae bacterium]